MRSAVVAVVQDQLPRGGDTGDQDGGTGASVGGGNGGTALGSFQSGSTGGSTFGGGGSGARRSTSGNHAGGSGANGRVTVTYNCPPNAGILSGTEIICGSGTTTFSSTVLGGSWSSDNNGVATIDPVTGIVTAVSAGSANMTYTIASSLCTTRTATRTVTVYASFSTGAISTTGETICYNSSPTVQIGNSISASGGDDIITYQWQSATDAGFTENLTTINDNTATYTPTGPLTVTTYYRRLTHDGTCNTSFTLSTGNWTVTVRPLFTSGAINTTGETICFNGDPTLIGSATDASGGDNLISYQWQADGVDISGANSSGYDPPARPTATTVYTRYAKDATCNTALAISSRKLDSNSTTSIYKWCD